MIEQKPSVFDVGAYIYELFCDEGPLKTFTASKMQKLVYYCQVWSLVWDERPLFKEKIYAWKNGPVVLELFEAHKGEFLISKPKGDSSHLDHEQKNTIKSICESYGTHSDQWLCDLILREYPRIDANEHNGEISLASMYEYYSSICSHQ